MSLNVDLPGVSPGPEPIFQLQPQPEANIQINIEEADETNEQDETQGLLDDFDESGESNGEMDFQASYSDYVIRQQQIATYQLLSQFLTYQDKNITETLTDIRVSLDALTKCILHITKSLDKHLNETSNK